MHRQQATDFRNLRAHLAETLADRALERQLVEASHEEFEVKVQPGCLAGIEVGNSYSGEPSPDSSEAIRLVVHDAASRVLIQCP